MLGLNSLDISNLVNEIGWLAGGRISKPYQVKSRFTFRLSTSQGSKNLNLVLPSILFLSDTIKFTCPKASQFSMSLRKYITNAVIIKIEQIGAERIIRFELEKANQRLYLLFELFSKGNIILTNSEHKILTIYSTQSWSSRELKRGLKYELPPGGPGFCVPKSELKDMLHTTKSESIVKFLAREIGLGGPYAEELCARAGIDKNKNPGITDSGSLFRTLQSFIKQKPSPTLVLKEGSPASFSSYPLDGECMQFPTLSLLQEEYIKNFSNAPIATNPQVEKYNRVIEQQKKHIETLNEQAQENSRKGEIIYEKYSELNELITKANEIARKHSWEQAFNWLKSRPRVKKLDKKTLSFTLSVS